MAMTPFQKLVKRAVMAETSAYDIVCKADGSVEVKDAYFYRPLHGVKGHVERIGVILSSIDADIRGEDRFRVWPATSYLVAVVTPREGGNEDV